MTDDGIGVVFVFLKEVIGTRKIYVGNIIVYFLRSMPRNKVRNQLTEKNFMITIQELFNDGEDILSSYPNITFLHTTFIFFRFIFLIISADIAQKKCQSIRTDILTVFIKNCLCFLDAQLIFFFVY